MPKPNPIATHQESTSHPESAPPTASPPPASTTKQSYVPTLLQLFRQFGYEGVTLTKISQATGLGKASLYHHFPGGKAEMAEAALNQANQWLETRILPRLAASATVVESRAENQPDLLLATFQTMCTETEQFFNQGNNACLWAVLVLAQSSDDLFHGKIRDAFAQWIAAIAQVLIAAGLDATLAHQRGEDAMIAIQGALILAHGLHDLAPFQRTLQQLPLQLCRDID